MTVPRHAPPAPRDARKPRVLLVGPRIVENDVVGGTQVSFEQLVDDLRRRANVEVDVVSTARPLAGRGALGKMRLNAAALLKTVARAWARAAAADLVLWCVSSRAAVLAGPPMWLVCALRGRPLCIRIFGGGFDARLADASPVSRFIAARTFLRAALLLFETRRLTAGLAPSCRTAWMPTTRDMPPRRRPYPASCRRLLFLSVLQREKGLPELVAAAERFPAAARLSVFGPAVPGFDVRRVERLPNASYGGVVDPGRVPDVLEAHDALVFPTRYPDEGYPGVVIEAFQMGLPVVAARHPSLDELITDGRDGLLVDSGSADALAAAVARLCSDDRLFRRLRAGALRTGERYRHRRATALVERLCRRAAGARAGPGRPPRTGTGRPPRNGARHPGRSSPSLTLR